MADQQARAGYLAVRQTRAAAEAARSEQLALVEQLRAALVAAGGAAAQPGLAARLSAAETAAAGAAADIGKLTVQAEDLRAAAIGTDEFGLLDQRVPVLLLPVRLEVRVGRSDHGRWRFDDQAAATHLVVRVYPDQVHLDGHEPELTPAEERAATTYTAGLPPLPADPEDVLPAWAELVAQVGPQRARWLAGVASAGGRPVHRPAGPGRAPLARLLPDRWQVRVSFGTAGAADAVGTGGLVREPLPVGPDPHTGSDALDWLHSLDAAFAAGMAVAVPLDGRAPADVTRVVCVGVRGTLTADATAADLTALLTAHRCTDGLALLPPGTPTTATAAGRSTRNEHAAATVQDAARETRTRLPTGCDGERLATALGLDRAMALRVDRADGAELSTERAVLGLLARLIQAALTDLLTPTVSAADVGGTLGYAVRWASAVGPLPALRVGSQPYGVLPIGRILHARPGAAWPADPAVRVMERFRTAVWADAAARVPRIQPGLDDPEQTLVELLRRDGAPAGYQVRLAAPAPIAEQLLAAGGRADIRQLAAMRAETARRLTSVLSGGRRRAGTRLEQLALAPAAAAGTAPLLSAPGQRPGDYLTELLGTPLLNLPDPALATGRPLLYHLARAALLEAADLAARRVLADLGEPVETYPAWSAGAPGTPEEDGTWTVWDRFGLGVSATETVADWLDAHRADPRAAELADVRAQLAVLIQRSRPARLDPPVAVEPILRAALGVPNRLDAFYTAAATVRLEAVRAARPVGLQVGGYGVLDGVFAGSLGPPAGGYVHAPGYPHAAAAAVLRSAHLSRSDGEQDPAVARSLAANLSSARVRDALRLLDGLRAGQPVTALLGQRLEERLVEAGRQTLLAPLRDRFPLLAGRLVPTGAAERPDTVAAAAVVDGTAALQAAGFPAPPAVDTGFLPAFRPLQPAEATDVAAALDAVADSLDALGDVLVAEGVFQLAQGNLSRASAALDFLAGAQVGVPEPEIVRTPRSASARPLRLLAILPAGAGTADPALASWPATRRGVAEPALAGWAAAALPAPADILVAGSRAAQPAPEPLTDTLAGLNAAALAAGRPDLTVGPLDLVLSAGGPPQDAGHPLAARLAALLALPAGVPPAAVTVDPTAAAGASFSVLAAAQAAHRLRDLVLGGRALEPADLTAEPAAGPWLAAHPTELAGRATAARDALDDLATRLGGWLAGLDAGADPDTAAAAVVPLLAEADQYGLPGAIPLGWDEPVAASRLRVAAVRAEAARRVAAVPAAPPDPAAAAAALSTLFGGTFLALPALVPDTPARLAQVAARIAADAAVPDRPDPATELARWAAVRAPAGRLEVVDLLTRVAGGRRATVTALDLPVHTPAGGAATAIGYQPAGPPWLGPALCGVALDAWVDTTPAAAETTTLTFHVDTPTSEPPNLWLLAVPAPDQDGWAAADAFGIVDEALDLARLRAVGPTDLGADQLLPPWWLWTEPRDPAPHWGTDPDELTREVP